ncbi:MAG: ribonuclease P protein component [Candidatus Vogelbacteria bacterium]|nr:ribonuclease P protein component [Candidatus Vogelbacteria bacterium]
MPKTLFPTILQSGRVWPTQFLSLRVWRDPTRSAPTSFAVITGSKVSGKAVERNLWKRRAHAILTELSPQLRDNHYCLLFFKKGITTLSFRQLSQTIRQVFLQANLLIN